MKNWKNLLIAGLLGVLLGQGVNMAYADEATPAGTELTAVQSGFSVCGKMPLAGETAVPKGWTVVGYSTALISQSHTSNFTGNLTSSRATSGHYILVCR